MPENKPRYPQLFVALPGHAVQYSHDIGIYLSAIAPQNLSKKQ